MKQDQHSRKRTHLLSAAVSSKIGKIVLMALIVLGGSIAIKAMSNTFVHNVQADGPINIWWPTNNAKVSGLQPFKAQVTGRDISQYDMTWSVDGGQQNSMSDSTVDSPHKEASVDLTSWNWHGSGPYHVTFKATDKSGNEIGESSVDIYGPDAAVAPKTILVGTSTAPTSDTSSVLIGALANISGVQTVAAQNTNPAQSQNQNQSQPQAQPSAPASISVWFPGANSTVTGTTAFKAAVANMSGNDYTMYWQVDGGQQNDMYTSDVGGTHKEASVDVSSWSWRGTGPYKITFTAVENGATIATSDVTIYTGPQSNQQNNSNNQNSPANSSLQNTQPTSTLVPITPSQNVSQPVAGNPLSGLKFYVDPNSNAAQQAAAWQSSRPSDANQMLKIAQSPEAIWLGGWESNVQSDVANKVSAAKSQGAVPVFIAYNIPGRDCGSFSAGGASDANSYKSWIQQVAAGLGGSKAVVVLEPDGLALTDCLSAQQKTDRYAMISDAVSTLKSAGAVVYLDAGHPNWVSSDDMASRLKSAGIDKADGFALNVSNFYATSDNISYGTELSGKVGGKHFVIDTSRNGVGSSSGQWCNPPGMALGTRNTANTGNSLVDAFLWLKNPGESDGNCNGGPSAGTWWPDYALDLAKRSAL